MSSLFITGASGFIGRAFLRTLDCSRYDHVYCLTRSGIRRSPASNVHWLHGSLREPETYCRALAASETVIHLAAVTGNARADEYFAANVEGTRVLVEQSLHAGIRTFLHLSSIAVKFHDKSHYPYARSKELAERELASSGLDFTIVRPTIVLGEGSAAWKGLSSLALGPILFVPGDGRALVQPIHVDDVARCLHVILAERTFSRETIELGGPETVPIESLLKSTYRARHRKEPRRIVHVPLRLPMKALALLEGRLHLLLPIGAGQLSAFCNDSTARPNPLYDRLVPDMKGIREMLAQPFKSGVREEIA